ncbi:hypothetical protein [Aeromicrobium wangtongii]|uniref:hypothetical protein n=1 Tax=Aeromicrobium wangtongii TaxID=2969247 RepID=UPI0020182224|nr:hypothetical protein [Aeromicrobium wangtongii]MCL3818549.1 hypothetical protein [Aeromicrobium wangtongii]
MNDQTPSPLDYVKKLEVVAAALKKCPHCPGGSRIVKSQAPGGLGVYRLAIEHDHHPDCPESEDFKGTAG